MAMMNFDDYQRQMYEAERQRAAQMYAPLSGWVGSNPLSGWVGMAQQTGMYPTETKSIVSSSETTMAVKPEEPEFNPVLLLGDDNEA